MSKVYKSFQTNLASKKEHAKTVITDCQVCWKKESMLRVERLEIK